MKTMSDTSEQMPVNVTDKPLVTFALFAYNQEQYIREAVDGAFAQTYEPLEIILSDDCSGDRTFKIMEKMAAEYSGEHSVVLRRNEVNIGLAAHFSQVIQESQGEIVIIAAGDDISFASRTEDSVKIFLKQPDVTAVLLSAEVINQAGEAVRLEIISRSKAKERIQTLQDLLSWRHATFGATRAIRKEVFTKFGPFQANCPTEDTPLLLRSLICGKNVLSPIKGIFYRTHNNNLSGAASLARMNTDAIYAQYEMDISKARMIGQISHEDEQKLLVWVFLDKKVRFFKQKITSGKELRVGDMFFVVRHRAFGVRTKLKAIVAKMTSFTKL